ncbi:MAG: endolytic transglycosylase MltG [Firmicutes bacterium]|nr:endolytic transglycosylase MltG [Bacillota bacterium]
MQYPTYLKTVRVKKKRIKIRLLLLAALAVFIAFKIHSVKTDIYGGGSIEPIPFEIRSGATFAEVAQNLGKQDIITYPRLFRLYSRFSANTSNVQFGVHTLTKAMSYNQILAEISEIAVPSDVVTVTIPEGSEISQTAHKLADAFLQKGLSFDIDAFLQQCDNGDFDFDFISQIKRKQNRLEGYLFPATYTITDEMSEHDIIFAMLSAFERQYTEEFAQRAKEINLSTDEVITLASIIEREGAGQDDFKTVSSVFHNRLKNQMKLDSCATVQYILGERKQVISTADTRISSPYNTYINFGLPIGPIASPGAAAIEAALYPADTDYLYFRLNEGRHVFSRTYREHQQAAP